MKNVGVYQGQNDLPRWQDLHWAGLQGVQVYYDPSGVSGITGVNVQDAIDQLAARGVQGNQGYQGWQGFQGVQGNQGWQGWQGTQGNQGYQGWQGNQGVQGPQGAQGFQGVQGNQGWQGWQGWQGTQGNQGLQGFQGLQGYQGWQGNQGTQGWQGYQGANSTYTESLTLVGAKGLMATNSYLEGVDGIALNVTPYVIPFGCQLSAMSLRTDGDFTWTAEVHVAGALKTNAVLASGGASGMQSASYGSVDNFNTGDNVAIYASGTGIQGPMVVAVLKRIS